jgi:hypothetical protein
VGFHDMLFVGNLVLFTVLKEFPRSVITLGEIMAEFIGKIKPIAEMGCNNKG